MKKLLMTLMALLLVAAPAALTGCATGSDGSRGVRVIENLSDDQFTDLLSYTETGVRLATSQILQRTDLDAAILTEVADALQDTAQEDAVVVVGGILSDVADRVLADRVDIPGDAIIAVLRFIEARVDFGGFVLPDGSVALTDRTKALISAVANGIHQGVAQQALGMSDPQINNSRYEDIVTVARQECLQYNAERTASTNN